MNIFFRYIEIDNFFANWIPLEHKFFYSLQTFFI
jgi:hypothetical protein